MDYEALMDERQKHVHEHFSSNSKLNDPEFIKKLLDWITFWRRNPSRFVQRYFGITLYLYQHIILYLMDICPSMLNEMVPLCWQAIDWKKSSILADHGTDTALRDLLEGLADKVKDIDTESLMQYAGILSEGTKGLGEGGILQGLLNARKA